MIDTTAPLFGRVMTAMITPFDEQLNVDYKATEKLVKHLISTGTNTIVVSGTTGESPTLEDSEKRELLKLVIEVAGGKAKVVVGTGSNSTAKSIKSSQEAEKLGADGLLVVAPYYNKPSQAGMLAHFSEIAKSTSLPIVVYNIPGRTGVNIAPDTMLKMIESDSNIYALKDSTGNVEQSAEIAGKAPSSFKIYSGDDYLTLPFLSIGGAGIISVASHIVGKEIAEMCDDFFAGKLDQARAKHYKYLPLFKGLFAAPNPTCVKYALSRMGICSEHLRLPLVPLTAQEKQVMNQLLEQVELTAQSSVA
ncbi:MAG TPA: 4-hydroxy-tetrahydrodipicolinate synthase [Drouetiella sp.]